MRGTADATLFFLLKKAHQALVGAAARSVSKAVDVPATQAAALVMVQRVNGCTVSDLGQLLGLHSAGTAGLVGRLEKQGLVRRVPSPEDARVSRVRITARGSKVASRAHEALLEIEKELRTLSPIADVQVIERFLGALCQRWREGGEA